MLSLSDPVSRLHLVNAASEKALQHLGIRTVSDLLFYFPRDWQDLSEIKPIAQIQPEEKVTIRATIKKLSQFRTPRRRMHLTEALLEDETGNILAVWFNQPFLKNSLLQGRAYYFHGKAGIYSSRTKRTPTLQLQNPAYELAKLETIHTAGIIPSYELTENLTQKQIRYWLKLALATLPELADPLPCDLLDRLQLLNLKNAITQIHFPKNHDSLLAARKRLSFEELFLFQLALQSYKRKLKAAPAPQVAFNTNLVKKFVESLPFTLTPSQRLAAWEILKDLAVSHPMNRLLEGEVGSGKTVVAGIAMLEVANAGWQSVLLAPTEILAWQHYQTLKELFNNTKLQTALLTRSHKITPSPSSPNEGVRKEGIIIGTHALLQERVKFSRIGLLVIDEQHRFGVKQRSMLQAAGQHGLVPHLLTMTATPIPRTLALAYYGDLDISLLRELPRGRKKIITKLVSPDKRPQAYDFIRKLIHKNQQAYVIAPLIDDSDKLGVKSATQEYKKLQREIFPEFQIGLLHGRLRGEEKKQIMDDFKAGLIKILVSTTVIEVGVDVPNATVMIIENAERFGLSQLHQLRGRIGRSTLQSYCLLFAEEPNPVTLARLAAVVKSTDGFELAEKDLELRGPGEIIGLRQSGFIPFKIARLSDRKLISLAKSEAEKLLQIDPELSSTPALKQKVASLSHHAHLE